jgi:hypothetical protein
MIFCAINSPQCFPFHLFIVFTCCRIGAGDCYQKFVYGSVAHPYVGPDPEKRPSLRRAPDPETNLSAARSQRQAHCLSIGRPDPETNRNSQDRPADLEMSLVRAPDLETSVSHRKMPGKLGEIGFKAIINCHKI